MRGLPYRKVDGRAEKIADARRVKRIAWCHDFAWAIPCAKMSMNTRKPMKEIAEAIILVQEAKG